ncbi:hypothetical protein FOZ61_003156 [Perkinsus olseni]|uniref:RRM domain-containing protein n=2 Tax=Perkinsus olseni TaxID=32597 RepID=A0A7J6LQU3_PEROL|nr:hypothetical protein FOZ61_003156 [Perkinsus olseni]
MLSRCSSPQMDKSNLIVNYLPSTFTEADLLEMFERYGAIQSIKIVRDKTTGISMGFGFVNFETNEGAEAAVDALNCTVLPEGKRMKVSVARPAWKANIHSNLYVSGLPLSYTRKDIDDLFGPEYTSHIESMRLLYDQGGQKFRGIAVVRFDTEESAYNAMRAFANCQLTDPVSKITSSMQLKPWRPEFRADRVDSEVMRDQLLRQQRSTTMQHLQPVVGGVAGPRGARAYSTGAFNIKPTATGGASQLTLPQQPSESSRYSSRSRFASSSIPTGVTRDYRPQLEVSENQQTSGSRSSWDSVWNEYLHHAINAQAAHQRKSGDGSGEAAGLVPPPPPQLLAAAAAAADPAYIVQAAAVAAAAIGQQGGGLPGFLSGGGGALHTPGVLSPQGLQTGRAGALAGSALLAAPQSSAAAAAAPSSSSSPPAALFIFHLPPECDDSTLRVLFEQYGQLDSVKVVVGKGYGFVNFVDWDCAQRAVDALNGFKLGSKRLKVEFKKARNDSAALAPGRQGPTPPASSSTQQFGEKIAEELDGGAGGEGEKAQEGELPAGSPEKSEDLRQSAEPAPSGEPLSITTTAK